MLNCAFATANAQAGCFLPFIGPSASMEVNRTFTNPMRVRDRERAGDVFVVVHSGGRAKSYNHRIVHSEWAWVPSFMSVRAFAIANAQTT